MPSEEHYDDSASIYFALAVLAIILLPFTLYYIRKLRKVNNSPYTGKCGCDACREKDRIAKEEARKPNAWSYIQFIIYICLVILFLYLARRATATAVPTEVAFDPYAILELDVGASEEEINKAKRRLSLVYHPDKNKAADANEKFIAIAKAHKTLTDPETREKWEKYGNPDGNTAFSVGIALPSFLVDTKNSMFVLAIYVLALIIIFPTIVVCYWSRQKELAHNQLNVKTVGLLWSVTEHMRFKKLLTRMSLAYEYVKQIELRRTDEPILKQLTAMLPETEKQPKSTKEKPGKKPKMVIMPHVIKNTILYFTHFGRLGRLLDQNLKKDSEIILNWSLPLAACIAEISASRRQTTPLIESIQISQMIVQAVWADSSRTQRDTSLLQFPHFTENTIAHLRKQKVQTVNQFIDMNKDAQLAFLKAEGFSASQIDDVEYVSSLLPYDVSVSTEFTVDDDEEEKLGVTAGSVVTLVVSFSRPSKPGGVIQEDKPASALDESKLIEAHCPFYPKKKFESWWIVMYDQSNVLYAIKKVNVLKDGTEVKVPFLSPPKEGNYVFTLHVLCDSYVGFDKKEALKIKVLKPVREDKLPKIKATEDEDDEIEEEESETPALEDSKPEDDISDSDSD